MSLSPDRDHLVQMQVADLGIEILKVLARAQSPFSANNFVVEYFSGLPPKQLPGGLVGLSPGQSPSQDRELATALLEGWQWLENEGLIAEDHLEHRPGWYFMTRMGRDTLRQLGLNA